MELPTKEATFSIVIPSWNRRQTLELAIRSIIDQTYPYWELIIIDDGSDDGTDKMLAEYQRRDQRIKVITHDTPKERWISYMEGYAAAEHDWIVSLASDDEFVYVALEQLNYAIRNNPGYKIMYYGYMLTSLGGTWARPVRELKEDPLPEWGMEHYDTGTIQGMCSMTFHRDCRDVFKEVPLFTNIYDIADWFGGRVEQYWKERGLEGSPPVHYSKDDKWCGNPWGDDHVFSWLLTRKYKAKQLEIRPCIAYVRTEPWLYERSIISGTMLC